MRSPCTATKSSPHSPQLEKARAQQRRPNAAKNKINKFIKKRKAQIQMEGTLPNSLDEANITLIPKPDKAITEKL